MRALELHEHRRDRLERVDLGLHPRVLGEVQETQDAPRLVVHQQRHGRAVDVVHAGRFL